MVMMMMAAVIDSVVFPFTIARQTLRAHFLVQWYANFEEDVEGEFWTENGAVAVVGIKF